MHRERDKPTGSPPGTLGWSPGSWLRETDLDQRVRHISERVDREFRNRPVPAPVPRHPWATAWQGKLLKYTIAVFAGAVGYFMSEWIRSANTRLPLNHRVVDDALVGYSIAPEPLFIMEPLLNGPPGWLISLTVALGMAWVFRGLARMFIEDFAWGRQW